MTTTYVPETDLSVDEINLADPDFWLRSDRWAALEILRRERPIAWHEHPECGKGFWSFVDYDDIREVTRDWQNFTSRYGTRAHHDADQGKVRPGSNAMIEMDPPEHTRFRRLVSKGFTPRQVAKMDEYIREQAKAVVGRFSTGEEVDFITDIARPLPAQIICDIMGVDQADRDDLIRWTELTMGEQDPDFMFSPEEGTKAMVALRDYGLALAEERERSPREDLISELVQVEVDGQRLTREELGGYFALLIVAGNETTSTTVAHGMHAFSEFPEEKERFASDPERWSPTATEELLRWSTPVRNQSRVLMNDIDFKGVHMRKGQKVATWFAAANRDPERFPDPHLFRIERDPNLHQSFGGGGPHFCLGANIARREISALFQELLRRFPGATVTEEPRPLRSMHINGIKSMQVRL
ncbi:cytochrome P450 [Nocardioides humi]|uniref:Methyl-branched lipid omega-hydroxylase Cyp124 n=1 Tax=Nocardioides humi TaxID=449461 RepID=A0ABN2AH57_9ACTN|nr:cytochrome P450 [Nocardioides humi]